MAGSLSPDQISQLRKSWSMIVQDPYQLASTLIIRLFKENPEYKLLFKKFKDISIDELATNSKFQSHASKVGVVLKSTIDFLDKPNELEKLLTDIGIKHKKYGLAPIHFQDLGNVLVRIITELLGSNDQELLDMWKSSLTSVMEIVITACF